MKLFDKLFYWTYLSPNDTGLLAETYVSIHFTNRRPALLVGEYGRDAAVLIDDNPRMLWGYLEDDVKKEIFEWIRVNKDPLLKYWNEEYSTVELLNGMKHMDMILNDNEKRVEENMDELLTVEEEARLALQIQHGEGDVESAKARLRNGNMRFVRAMAKQYAAEGHPLDEIIAEGVNGLEAAMYKFDPSRGFKFISYAVWYIRRAIREHLEEQMRNKKLPLYNLTERERDIISMYYGIGCEKSDIDKICEKYQLTRKRFIYIEQNALRKLFYHISE